MVSKLKYMSLGDACHTAWLLSDLGRRISGPLDWMYNLHGPTIIIDLFSDLLFTEFLQGKFSKLPDYEGFEVGSVFNYNKDIQFLHEDFSVDKERVKEACRFARFRELARNNGNFIWICSHLGKSIVLLDNYLTKNIDKFKINKFLVMYYETNSDKIDSIKNMKFYKINSNPNYYPFDKDSITSDLNKEVEEILNKEDEL